MIYKIKTYGNHHLREVSVPVEKFDEDLLTLLEDMYSTMVEASGVGLAAPQIGINKRIFIMAPPEGKRRNVVNPKILNFSEEMEILEEGCLSVPNIHNKVKRPYAIEVEYQDEKGKVIKENFEGLEARIFQHEFDHLEATLFVDLLSPIAKNMVSKKLKKLKKLSD